MLLGLALIPVIFLLLFIYKRDKKEKEPMGLLIGLFFAGMCTCITAFIGELIGELIFSAIFAYDSPTKVFLYAMLIVGPVEELGKYFVLRIITWKNKNFDYSYDAIVYAVFASLGFAALENVLYVFSNGVGIGFLRMFTALPGHASFAVFMGYFYSKAKYASLIGNEGDYKKYIARTLYIPIIFHGLYDAIVLSGTAQESLLMAGSLLLLWVASVIVLFVFSFITVLTASKNDFCIVNLPDNNQTVYIPRMEGEWTCGCGQINNLNFCSRCGRVRPMGAIWHCPVCGSPSIYNFCGVCGSPKQ